MKYLLVVILNVNLILIQCKYLEKECEWNSWKAKHAKIYNGREEEQRRKIWEDNRIFVDNLNANSSFNLEVNKFGDLVSLLKCYISNMLSP